MMTFIIIATLMSVAAVAVTVCVMQKKEIVLINQNKNLLVQLSEEKAKATKVLSEKEKELNVSKLLKKNAKALLKQMEKEGLSKKDFLALFDNE